LFNGGERIRDERIHDERIHGDKLDKQRSNRIHERGVRGERSELNASYGGRLQHERPGEQHGQRLPRGCPGLAQEQLRCRLELEPGRGQQLEQLEERWSEP